MIKIRLARKGRKKNPVFRIVVSEKRKKREGPVIDIIGYWIPQKSEKKIDSKKLDYWRDLGAQETQAVKKLLSK